MLETIVSILAVIVLILGTIFLAMIIIRFVMDGF